MILIYGLIVILICGILVWKLHDNDGYQSGGLIVVLSLVFLFVAILVMYINYYTTISNIQQYYATKKTIEVARERNNDFENAALQQNIIKTNEWLAGDKYWNKSTFDVAIPDEVDSLKFLE